MAYPVSSGVLVNSSLKGTKKKRMAKVISKT